MTLVVIAGANGQVGRELSRADWAPGFELVALDRSKLDITDRDQVIRQVSEVRPDVIVNAAAYTAVDRAESEPELAEAVNATAVGHLADAANTVGALLIQISTDYVFDGSKEGWYSESDPIAPLGVYGRTKALGEEQAKRAAKHLILRTAWVYGALGNNFVVTMRRLARTHEEVRVVDDQIGCPTSAADIAAAISSMTAAGVAEAPTGTYHLASPEAATWFEFAQTILADQIDSGLRVTPIPSSEYPTPARRPANSRLDSTALFHASGIRLPSWHDSVRSVIAELEDHTIATERVQE